MPTYKQKALEVLKNHKFRITKPREMVIELLGKSKEPLNPYEMKDLLDRKHNKIDIVSIYRIIKCLEDNNLVHRVLSTNKVAKCQIEHEDKCTKESNHHCHHLLICEKCSSIEEVHCAGVDLIIKKLEKDSNFKIKRHDLEFYGFCSNCIKAKKKN